jgi:hypothetical protein
VQQPYTTVTAWAFPNVISVLGPHDVGVVEEHVARRYIVALVVDVVVESFFAWPCSLISTLLYGIG